MPEHRPNLGRKIVEKSKERKIKDESDRISDIFPNNYNMA